MGTPVDLYPHDQAVLDALGALGLPVGLSEPAEGAYEALISETTPGPAYLVVHPINDTRSGSTLAPYEDIRATYQITIVDRAAETVRALVSDVESALQAVTIPGRAVVAFQPVDGGGVRPDPIRPLVFVATPRFAFWTTPIT